MRDTCFWFSYFACFRTAQHISLLVCEGDQWTACVKEIEGAYLIKNHRNSLLLFGYYKLGFRCLELNLFSNCFDLKDLSPNKRFELIIYLNKCPKCMLFTLPDQSTAAKQAFIFANKQNPVLYVAS